MRRKVCVVVTARPSYSRIKTALKAIAEHADLDLQIVVGASALLTHRAGTARYIEEDGFEIAERVPVAIDGNDLPAMARATGFGLLELTTVFARIKPDVVVTVGDRYETLATATAAAYLNIAVAHVMGGEITGSIDEKVRHAVTKLADVHLVATAQAVKRVIRMGERPEAVFNTGCPSIDLARVMLERPELDFDPVEKYRGEGAPLDCSKPYVVVLQHPVTTEYEQASRQVCETLHAIVEHGLPTAWFWPNVDAGSDAMSRTIEAFCQRERPENLCFFRDMAPPDFLRLLYNSRCLVGNSSAGIRECAFLGVPAVNIGQRQAGRDRACNVIDVAHNREDIGRAMTRHESVGHFAQNALYGDGWAGPRIAEVLATTDLSIEKRLPY